MNGGIRRKWLAAIAILFGCISVAAKLWQPAVIEPQSPDAVAAGAVATPAASRPWREAHSRPKADGPICVETGRSTQASREYVPAETADQFPSAAFRFEEQSHAQPPKREEIAVKHPATPPSPAISALTCVDLDGVPHRLCDDPQALALIFLSTDCPISNSYVPSLNRLAGQWSTRGVRVYGVISSPTVSRWEARQHRSTYGINFPVLFDTSGELRQQFIPTHVPQAFVLDSGGCLVYSGRIDDRYPSVGRKSPRAGKSYLADALQAVAAGRAPEIARTELVGCVIGGSTTASADSGVTYCREIVPIIHAYCLSCHRPGEVAPFPLTSYEEVRRHAEQIALVTRDRVMPPWRAEEGFGQFKHHRRLSEREIELLDLWAAAGAPEGEAADLPPEPEFAEGWQLGPPDLVLELPEHFEVPAEGDDIYQYFVLATGLEEDRMVTAVEFRPSCRRAVHHASFCYDISGQARRLDEAEPGPGYGRFGGPGFSPAGSLGGWGPGRMPRHLPPGLGRLLRKGADLVLQVHYHPTGKIERDRPVVGLHFAKEPINQRLAEILVANFALRVPAGEPSFVHEASYVLPVETIVHGIVPHMHLLGREIQAVATRPDGSTQPLIRIPDWDFNWQDQYLYASPLQLPAGTRIDVTCRYDNSSANPMNPHEPPRPVQWGERSEDEMGICYLDVTTQEPADLEFLLQHNHAYLQDQIEQNPWLLQPPPDADVAAARHLSARLRRGI